MTDQKWYQKATVQSAIVAAIPSLITAVIAILAIHYTQRAANSQFNLDKGQYTRDSINSVLQLELVKKQIELANKSFLNDSIITAKQLRIANENIQILNKEINIKKTADWGKLRNTMWEIMDLTSSVYEGFLGLEKLPIDEKIKRSNRIWELLNSEINNPVLIENKRCLGYWRNAISKAKLLKDNNTYEILKFSDQISSLMNDIFIIWIELVLNSKEVYATGGKPFNEK